MYQRKGNQILYNITISYGSHQQITVKSVFNFDFKFFRLFLTNRLANIAVKKVHCIQGINNNFPMHIKKKMFQKCDYEKIY